MSKKSKKVKKQEEHFEVRNIPIEVRAIEDEEDGKLIVAGLVNSTGKQSEWLGSFYEVIQPGAFNESLAVSDVVDFLYEHDPDKILASTENTSLQLFEDSTGLQMRAEIIPTSIGKDAYEMIKSGIVSHMSFGFVTKKERYDRARKTRYVEAMDLIEVSAVRNPAYIDTQLLARSLNKINEKEKRMLVLTQDDNFYNATLGYDNAFPVVIEPGKMVSFNEIRAIAIRSFMAYGEEVGDPATGIMNQEAFIREELNDFINALGTNMYKLIDDTYQFETFIDDVYGAIQYVSQKELVDEAAQNRVLSESLSNTWLDTMEPEQVKELLTRSLGEVVSIEVPDGVKKAEEEMGGVVAVDSIEDTMECASQITPEQIKEALDRVISIRSGESLNITPQSDIYNTILKIRADGFDPNEDKDATDTSLEAKISDIVTKKLKGQNIDGSGSDRASEKRAMDSRNNLLQEFCNSLGLEGECEVKIKLNADGGMRCFEVQREGQGEDQRKESEDPLYYVNQITEEYQSPAQLDKFVEMASMDDLQTQQFQDVLSGDDIIAEDLPVDEFQEALNQGIDPANMNYRVYQELLEDMMKELG